MSKPFIRSLASVTFVAIAGLLVSCGQGSSREAPVSAPSSTAEKSAVDGARALVRPDGPLVSTEASWVKIPGSLEDLAADSVAIVRATWTGETRWERVGSGDAAVDFPVSTMRIEQVIAGRVPDRIDVRMSVVQADGTSPLDTDREYVLFLMPFWFTPGEDTGQWTTADGPFGLFFGAPGDNDFFGVMPEGHSRIERLDAREISTLRVATVEQLKARA